MNLSFIPGKLAHLIIHRVGNKSADEQFFLSKKPVNLDADLSSLMSAYLQSNFKSEETYQFYHDMGLALNEVYTAVSSIFAQPETCFEYSQHLAQHLYNQSNHPKIKGGEFMTVYFENCVINGMQTDAIGLFKSENKETFLELIQQQDGFNINSREGINMNKIDKGCLIFNQDSDKGFLLSIIDNTNKNNEAHYWKDDFLSVLTCNNNYQQTNHFLGMAKNYITQQLDKDFEVSKADQIDYLNRSIEYFKKHDSFVKDIFEAEVLESETLISSFNQYNNQYKKENDIEIETQFDISNQALKKQTKAFKSVLKLDKNFHIYIHGDRKLISQGEDENGQKFYKIYYKEEH